MRIPTMAINKVELWWCRKLTASSYAAPVRVLANAMPTNSDGDILAYGASFPEYLRLKGDLNASLSGVSEDDKFYFRKDLPETHDATQTTTTSANFFVSSRPIITKHTVDITLKRIPNR